ncbi:GntR family transcriptional regulator [Burkholderia lata]|nr:GntR family transcriptional regulator [Burkholderia lata]
MVARHVSRHASPTLVEIDVHRHLDEPIVRQIVRQLRGLIDSGRLQSDARLPASRDLAAQLGVARNCVVNAYDELIAVGLLEGRGRHGTFVRSGASGGSVRPAPHTPLPAVLERLQAPTPVDETGGVASLDWRPESAHAHALPLGVWRNACREAGRHLPPQDYGDPRGERGLRRGIARWLRTHRSVDVDPDHVVVTHGVGNDLQLVSQALLNGGDLCVIEDPGYQRAMTAFTRAGATVRPVPVDRDGLLVEHVVVDGAVPQMVHITPAHQYPLGGRLPRSRREALIELARQHGILIVEHEYDSEFQHEGTRLPPIFASAPDTTMLIGTFARVVGPSLRLGFIVAPSAVAEALAAFVDRECRHVSLPAQRVAEFLLASGQLDRHLRRMQRHYAAMRNTLLARLAVHADRIDLHGDRVGLHVWIAGRDPAFDRALRAALQSRGIRFNEVARFSTLNGDVPGFVFGYGYLTPAMLERSLDEIDDCIRALTGGAS